MNNKSKPNRVIVKPLPLEKWHQKSAKESFTVDKSIQAQPDRTNFEYKVDLTEKEWEKIYNAKLGFDIVDKDENGKIITNLNFDPETPHKFFSTNRGRVKLPNKSTIFNKNVPVHLLKIGILRGSPYVANSLAEWEEGNYDLATHYIEDKAKEIETSLSKVEAKNEAVLKASKATKEQKVNVLKCLIPGFKKPNENTDGFITMAIDEELNRDPSNFLRWLNKDKKEVAMEAMVNDAIDQGVLKKEGHKIKYFDTLLGNSTQEVVDYMMDDENQTFMLQIKDKISN